MSNVLAVTSPYGIGAGEQYPLTLPNPGAGANLTYAIDGNYRKRILSLVFTVTAANAGSDRYVTVEFRGKDGLPFSVNAPATLLTVNTAERYCGSTSYSVSDFNTGTDLFFPLDQVLLFPGDQMVIAITTLNASDAITNIRGVEERFPYDTRTLPLIESG